MEMKQIQEATLWEYTSAVEQAIKEGFFVASYESVAHMPQNNGVFFSVTMQKGEPNEQPQTGEQVVEKPEPVDELQEAVKNVKAASEEKPARQASTRKPKQ